MPPVGEPNRTTSYIAPTAPYQLGHTVCSRLILTVDRRGAHALRIAPSGDLDLATAGTLVDEVMRQLRGPDRLLVLNFAGVRFCDSSGINALVKIRNHCDSNDTQLQLTNLIPDIHYVLVEITGLGGYLGAQSPREQD